MLTVQQLYHQKIKFLPEIEQLKLAVLILEGVIAERSARQPQPTESITDSGEILDEDLEAASLEIREQFLKAIEKSGNEVQG